MSNSEILEALEARSAKATITGGPAGEVQQRATRIISNQLVTVIRRDGAIHHYEIETIDFETLVTRDRSAALDFLSI